MAEPTDVSDVNDVESAEPESQTAHEDRPAAVAKCVHCGHDMARDVLPAFHRGYGITVLVVGVLLALFVSLLLGLPMVVIGAYMGAANKAVWACPNCRAVTERAKT